MARYIQQKGMTLPSEGNNTIHHFVKTFQSYDSDLLDIDMNVWLLSLEDLVSSPIIQAINFSNIVSPEPMSSLQYIAQVHFILVE
jgi:hypothetical protein